VDVPGWGSAAPSHCCPLPNDVVLGPGLGSCGFGEFGVATLCDFFCSMDQLVAKSFKNHLPPSFLE